MAGGGDLVIAGGVFRHNVAAKGSALSSISPRSLKISNTTFDDLVGAFAGEAAEVQVSTLSVDCNLLNCMIMCTFSQDCAANPCNLGESCTFLMHSTFCDRCASNEIGPNGVACTACPSGTEPNAEQTACVPCPPGMESKIGLCTTCPAGKIGTGGTCSGCPGPNEEPIDRATRCQCQAGFYNSSYGLVQCPDQGDATQPRLVCQPCGDCLDCIVGDSGHMALVRPGFALGPAAAATYQGIQAGAPHVDKVLHRCVKCTHTPQALNSLCMRTLCLEHF